MKRDNKQYGYTVMELVTVAAIVFILGAIAITQFFYLQIKAENTKKRSALNGVRSALAIYVADKGEFPTTQQLARSIQNQSGNAKVITNGQHLHFSIKGTNFMIETHKHYDCTGSTKQGDKVKCVTLPSI